MVVEKIDGHFVLGAEEKAEAKVYVAALKACIEILKAEKKVHMDMVTKLCVVISTSKSKAKAFEKASVAQESRLHDGT